VPRASPVNITMRSPSARSALSADGVLSLIASPTAMAPAKYAIDGDEHDRAPRERSSSPSRSRASMDAPTSFMSAALPSASVPRACRPVTPLPVTD
jgi:hypothetical protein